MSVTRAPSRFIAAGLSLAPASSNGLGRFAYALILPAMRKDLGWSYTQAGWVNTANALGYLAGAVLALRLLARNGPHRLFRHGMVWTAVALLASGLVRDYGVLLGLRFVAGVAGALAFIGGGALVAELFAHHPERSAGGIALYFGGGGLGIVASGLPLPWLFELRGASAWNEAWIGVGLLAALACVPSFLAARRVPHVEARAAPARLRPGPLLVSLGAYFAFALGSIVYMTFIIAFMRERGAGPGAVAAVWGLLGAAIMLSPLPWRGPLQRWGGGRTLAAAMLACAAGAVVPLLGASLPSMLVSATLFGGSFFIPPAAVTTLARRALPREAWGAGFAAYTVAFGAGQPIGPVLAGFVADRSGTLFAGLLTSVAVLVAGAAAALLQRDVTQPRTG